MSPKTDHTAPTPAKDKVDSSKLFPSNANSVHGKLNDLQGFIEVQDPDVIAMIKKQRLVQVWHTTAELFPHELNFLIFRKDRSLSRGGVVLAIEYALDPIPFPDLEILHLRVHGLFLSGRTHYFCSFCHPPQQPIDEKESLREQLDRINKSHPPAKQPGVHIFGDTNLGKID